MIVDLTYLKAHLRIDGNDENTLLTSYAEACEDIVMKYLNCNVDDLFDTYGKIPAAVKNAVCMLVGAMYRDREATSTMGVNVNPMVVAMLKPYKKIFAL